MPYISPRGNPDSKLWVVFERPFSTDVPPSGKGILCSGGIGYAFQKMLQEANLNPADVYFCCRRPDTDTPSGFVLPHFDSHKPPLLLVVGEAAQHYLRELEPLPKQDSWKSQLNKYVGSLLKCPQFQWDHWIMPLKDPQDLMADWSERNVTTYIDIGKMREELAFYKKNGTIQPLRQRTLLSHEMDTDELLTRLDSFRTSPYLAEDIETVYPRKGSAYYQKHPGIPVTMGIAPNADFGISFSLFRETPAASREVWRKFDKLHTGGATIIGQNFFNFDSLFYNMMGFTLRREHFQDTLIRHHILWPELSHKLQFLTRQYTREPFYKDEGHNWKLSQMQNLRRYNCLDCTVTFEVFEEQEKEFDQRPHLKG